MQTYGIGVLEILSREDDSRYARVVCSKMPKGGGGGVNSWLHTGVVPRLLKLLYIYSHSTLYFAGRLYALTYCMAFSHAASGFRLPRKLVLCPVKPFGVKYAP